MLDSLPHGLRLGADVIGVPPPQHALEFAMAGVRDVLVDVEVAYAHASRHGAQLSVGQPDLPCHTQPLTSDIWQWAVEW